MHSCSDKRKLVRSSAAQHMFQLQPLKTQHHAAVWPQGSGRGGRKGGEGEMSLFLFFFLIPGLCGAWGESSQRYRNERDRVSEQSFLQPRKEGRVSASV